MANRVIFLDFDGPMFPDRTVQFDVRNRYKHRASVWAGGGDDIVCNKEVKDFFEACESEVGRRWGTYCFMCPSAVGMINHLGFNYDARIVVSSSWGNIFTKNDIEALFELNGIVVPFHENWNIWTDPMQRGRQRANLIAQWMKENKYMDYVIIDDPQSGACLCDQYEMTKLGFDLDRIIIVDPEVGLTMGDINQIKNQWET